MSEKKHTTLKKLLMIFGGIIILIIIVSLLRGKGASPNVPATGLVTSSGTGAPLTAGIPASGESATSDQTAELVRLLQEVSTLKLSNDVFLNPVFGALVDISSPIAPDPNPGRTNPFRAIGEDVGLVDLGITLNNAGNSDNNILDTFLNQAPPTP